MRSVASNGKSTSHRLGTHRSRRHIEDTYRVGLSQISQEFDLGDIRRTVAETNLINQLLLEAILDLRDHFLHLRLSETEGNDGQL